MIRISNFPSAFSPYICTINKKQLNFNVNSNGKENDRLLMRNHSLYADDRYIFYKV